MGLALRKESSNEIYNPYLAARREWDERYGEFISRARNWRTAAILCALAALLGTAGIVWLAARSRVIPFVVLIDSLGRPVASGLAEQTSPGDDRLRRAVIQDWIENLRMVTTDGIAQRRAIDRVYAQIASGSSAQTFISDYYRNDPPFKRAQTGTVSVDVNSVLPTSDRTFEVDWIETSRDLYGNVKSTDHWKGTFTIALNPPSDEREARINPLGLYVTAASWSKVL
ncbi:MAG TPA: conjugal transfer protein TrbF [Bryobacteraceae bacterium]|nr:conjugal transfer protein TrbF [Bryobacteraceae bacterium]